MLNKTMLFLVLAALVMTGCADEDKTPIVTQDTLLFGAFPRLIELRTGEYDLDNKETSAYEMQVDFVDNAGGADVAQYRVFVSFDDNNPDNGDNSTGFELFETYEPSDFTAGPNGNLGLNVVIPFSAAASFAGVASDDVLSGDRFRFRTEVVKDDGRVFSSANSTSAITSAFGGIFNFDVNATCPLSDDVFVGTYVMTYDEVYDVASLFGRSIQAFEFVEGGGWSREVTLELVPGSTTRRSITTSYLVPSDLTINVVGDLDFACDQVLSTWTEQANIRCSSAFRGWHPEDDEASPFNLADDSEFTLDLRDFGDGADGGCGVPAMTYTVRLTKQ